VTFTIGYVGGSVPAGGAIQEVRSRADRRAGLLTCRVDGCAGDDVPILWMDFVDGVQAGPARLPLTARICCPAHPTLGNFRSVIDGKVIGLPFTGASGRTACR